MYLVRMVSLSPGEGQDSCACFQKRQANRGDPAMIIDCHCHAGKGDIMTAPWNTDAPLGAYLRRARRAGIKRTVVFPVFQSDYSVGNRYLARLVARLPGRLTGFAMLHASRDAGQIREMVCEAVLEYGFRGIKVHGLESMPTREVCEVASEFNVPVLVDVVGKAHVVDVFAPQYPTVNFIVAHLGSFADDWRAHERVIEQLVRYKNVYADTSGVRRFDYIVQAVKRAGAEKILFGSDGPWLHPGVELYKIRMLKLPAECEKLILGGNAARLILDRRVGRRQGTDYARSALAGPIRRTRMTTLGERRTYYS